ncbi:hypothetical protein ACFSX9_15480 [Flavobacterium ardleyense]|uniref:Uncharacterized protein n=1 Tax=Flavobacterium ardleyense TaxID=2038737 RepID=A0ABW5ZDG9_9FLAO
MRKVFYKKMTSEITEIKLTENGFSLNETFGAKANLFKWNEINNIHFSENNENVIIEKSDKKFVLKNCNIGWYDLIQNVPLNFTNFDFAYVKNFIESLKPCKICGIVALNKNECIVCENVPWNSAMTETEIDYIKTKQLDFYSESINEKREIKKIAEPEHGFKADKNWKLYI